MKAYVKTCAEGQCGRPVDKIFSQEATKPFKLSQSIPTISFFDLINNKVRLLVLVVMIV